MWVNLGDGDHILTAFSWCVERSAIAVPRVSVPEAIIAAGDAEKQRG